MSVKKLFWAEPRRFKNTAVVTSVADNKITVSETVFFAESGGQESDYGTIGGFAVLRAEWVEKEIYYYLEKAHTLKIGDSVGIIIEQERREKLIKSHFSAEVVLEVITQNMPDIVKCGAHIAPGKARIDFIWAESLKPEFPWVAEKANALFAQDLPIESAFEDETNERRYWKIDGFAQVPCGGTHPAKTGEIGAVSLKRKNIGKGKERVEIYVENLT